jgi:hypothetical protein
MRQHGIDFDSKDPSVPYVENSGGFEKLLTSGAAGLEAAVKSKVRLGFVIDADHPPYDRWAQLRGHFQKLNVALPATAHANGTIVSGTRADWKVGVWMMPDNVSRGRLEEFLATLIPPEDPLWPHAGQASEAAQVLGAGFQPIDFIKARMHAWLAWQKAPGKPYGTALEARFFVPDSSTALAFVAWFKALFALEKDPKTDV